MNIKQLKAFVKVVEAGSFTKAADILGSQKSHVSRTISQLETQLKVRLLSRSTRRLGLTPEGKDFYERAVAILQAIDEAQTAMQEVNSRPAGHLKVACGNEFGQLAVIHWIHAFLKQYPDVTLEADFSNRKVDLLHEGFDLGIRLGYQKDSPLYAKKLGEIEYGVFGHSAFPNVHMIKTPSDLNTHKLCVFSGGKHHLEWRFQHRKTGQKVSVQPVPHLSINNSFGVKTALGAQLGVGILPRLIVDKDLKTDVLTEILTDWEIPSVPVYAVYPEIKYKTPKVRCFIEVAHEMMQNLQVASV